MGSAVSPPIRNFSQKVLKIAIPMASKIIENHKNPHPGTLRKHTQFLVGISNTFNDFGCHFMVPQKGFFCDFLESGPEGAPGWSQGHLFASSDVTFWSKLYKKGARNLIYLLFHKKENQRYRLD